MRLFFVSRRVILVPLSVAAMLVATTAFALAELSNTREIPVTTNLDQAIETLAKEVSSKIGGNSYAFPGFQIDGASITNRRVTKQFDAELRKTGLDAPVPFDAVNTVAGNLSIYKSNNVKKGLTIRIELKQGGETIDKFAIAVADERLVPIVDAGIHPGHPGDEPRDSSGSITTNLAVSATQAVSGRSDSPYRVVVIDALTNQPVPIKRINKTACEARLAMGQTFKLRLENDSEYAAAADVSIDGLNRYVTMEGNKASDVYYDIVPKKSKIAIQGWKRDSGHDLAFKVSKAEEAVFSKIAPPSQADIGVISVAFFAAWQDGEDIPPSETKPREVSSDGIASDPEIGISGGEPVLAPIEFKDYNIGRPMVTIKIAYSLKKSDDMDHESRDSVEPSSDDDQKSRSPRRKTGAD